VKRRVKGWERTVRRWLGWEIDKRNRARLKGGDKQSKTESSRRTDNLFSAGPNAPPALFFARYYKLQFAMRRKRP
jgi:hypothetical protein